MEKIKYHDFIELDYTGRLPDGTVFDTTLAEAAKKNNLFSDKMKYSPAVICVGEKQILPGLDIQLEGKEIGQDYEITLSPEEAFGKRDIKKIKIVPQSTFREHRVEPQPGLQINVDGELGIVTRVSGGRIMVNFNHPLAGKEVVYEVKIIRKITELPEQVTAYLHSVLGVPLEKIAVEIKEGKAEIKLLFDLPPLVKETLQKKLIELVGVKEVKFVKKGQS